MFSFAQSNANNKSNKPEHFILVLIAVLHNEGSVESLQM